MAQEVEIWFEAAPSPAAVAGALAAFGELHEMRDGTLRLVEGDEPPREGVPLALVEEAPPDAVRRALPAARAALRASALLTSSRGFWLGRIAVEIQRRLGGVVYLPSTGDAFSDPDSFESSWPSEHGGHGH